MTTREMDTPWSTRYPMDASAMATLMDARNPHA